MAGAEPLLGEIETLIERVVADAGETMAGWDEWDIQPDFQPSAANLAAYLALRHHDLRPLQRRLMQLGLSSLGRLESRVLPSLRAVAAALRAMTGKAPLPTRADPAFLAGDERLRQRTRALFGPRHPDREVALLVTAPTSAADDPAFMRQLAFRQVQAVRINCAHDDAEVWGRMVDHARAASEKAGRPLRVFIDLAGPKLRTGEVRSPHNVKRVFPGDRIALVPAGALATPVPADVAMVAECTLPEAFAAATPGQRVMFDDGKIAATVDIRRPGLLLLTVVHTKEDGAKLKPEKGINLPDAQLSVPALTSRDRADLAFVASHADAIEFSFVQSAEDVAELQAELARLRPDDWQEIALVLKIETARAIENLPQIIVRAAARQPVAVMIARGDLAIEIGFARLAEMQEEILWIAEAAQVPVIWATQVLEQLVKDGTPHRGELTDAAMAARANASCSTRAPTCSKPSTRSTPFSPAWTTTSTRRPRNCVGSTPGSPRTGTAAIACGLPLHTAKEPADDQARPPAQAHRRHQAAAQRAQDPRPLARRTRPGPAPHPDRHRARRRRRRPGRT
jgi:pyruvate kinase